MIHLFWLSIFFNSFPLKLLEPQLLPLELLETLLDEPYKKGLLLSQILQSVVIFMVLFALVEIRIELAGGFVDPLERLCGLLEGAGDLGRDFVRFNRSV